MGKVESIRQFIEGHLLDGAELIKEDTPLFSAGILDSFHLVELLMFLEETFGTRISPAEIRPELIDTPAAIAALVAEKAS